MILFLFSAVMLVLIVTAVMLSIFSAVMLVLVVTSDVRDQIKLLSEQNSVCRSS